MGSPRVFHTAPPHPASNARITWSPQLAGGPEASQNGLGHRIFPANSVVKSAMIHSQEVGDPDGGSFAPGDSVHHFPAPIRTIASRKIFRIGGLTGFGLHNDISRPHF